MPNFNPRYEKTPRPESIAAFKKFVSGHSKVEKVEALSDILYIVHRDKMMSIKVFLTNIYTVSHADVVEILSINKNIDAIVTMSAWNSYTQEADLYCKSQGKGLFCFREFMGALNYDGKKFINYRPKKD